MNVSEGNECKNISKSEDIKNNESDNNSINDDVNKSDENKLVHEREETKEGVIDKREDKDTYRGERRVVSRSSERELTIGRDIPCSSQEHHAKTKKTKMERSFDSTINLATVEQLESISEQHCCLTSKTVESEKSKILEAATIHEKKKKKKEKKKKKR